MGLRSMSTERLVGVSTRLLAGASVLSAVGLGLVIRFAWQQAGQSYGPDGTPSDSSLPFAQQLTLVVFDLNYRQLGVQMLLACALVGAAVAALHRNRSWEEVRRLRWEVLGAGLLSLALVVVLVLAHLYVMTAPDAAFAAGGYIGPQPVTEMILGNLITLGAALLVLTAAALWWLRLEAGADGTDDDSVDDDPDGSVEQEAAESQPTPTQVSLDSSDSPDGGAAEDYQHDWSPEDFRPPR